MTDFRYRRIDHFREILGRLTEDRINQQLAKIPESVLTDLRTDLARDQVTSDQINYSKIRRYLKARSAGPGYYNQYYDSIIIIIRLLQRGELNYHQIPALTDDDYQYLLKYCCIFLNHWDQICQSHFNQQRRSFSYNQVINRLIQLLKLSPEYLIYFPPLRSPEKEHTFDQTWALICQEIGWPTPPQTLPDWAQTVIAKHWRRILAQRRYQRLKIGQELILLPEIGIEYQLAKSRFEGES